MIRIITGRDVGSTRLGPRSVGSDRSGPPDHLPKPMTINAKNVAPSINAAAMIIAS